MDGITIFGIAYYAIGLIVAIIAKAVMPNVRFLLVWFTYPLFLILWLVNAIIKRKQRKE